jgi:decaprenylphospho-beta-D-erythro-pentofuranosid-2-ulose 2-reductase
MSAPRGLLICGATSAIAGAAARCSAASHDRLFLVGRDPEKLGAVADDLRVRGAAQVETYVTDLNDITRHQAIIDECAQRLSGFDTVLIAHGTLPDQAACEASFDATRAELETNLMSVVSLLTRVGNHFEQRREGTIAVISSVAGDRGRQSNYVYGTAKGAVSIFLQGLRNRLHRSGVRVITIKPGFVDTPMTAHFPKNPLWADASAVGRGVYRALCGGSDVVYLPWFWRPIMVLIRSVPERMFKRLRL